MERGGGSEARPNGNLATFGKKNLNFWGGSPPLGPLKTRAKNIHFWTNGEQFCTINIFFGFSLENFKKSHISLNF